MRSPVAKPEQDRRPEAAAIIPGPAALAALLPDLWEHHRVLSKGRATLDAAAIMARINATEAMIASGKAATLADTAAQLLMALNDVYLNANDLDGEEARRIEAHVEAAFRPLALLSRLSGFALAEIGAPYMTPNMEAVARGEVVA